MKRDTAPLRAAGHAMEITSKTICFVNSAIAWGGGEKWHLDAATSLAARGWRVFLVCHPDGQLRRRAENRPGLTVVPMAIGKTSFLNPLMHARLRKLFRNESVRAVVMNLTYDLKLAGPAAKRAGVPHAIYRRGSAIPIKNTFFNRRLFADVVTRFIANSNATRQQALAKNPRLIPGDRISVLYNGVDVDAFDKAYARTEGRPKDSRFVIGSAGRLEVEKGHHMLLRLGKRLVDAGLDCSLAIAGGGELRDRLGDMAKRLGIADRVDFRGFLDDMSPFWRDIDLFVLPSLWEGFGFVLIEAMLAAKPVFAFNVSAMAELVVDKVNGRLFPVPREEWKKCPDLAHQADPAERYDPWSLEPGGYAELDGMAEAVLELAGRPDLRDKMGKAGREYALTFSQESRMDELENLLR